MKKFPSLLFLLYSFYAVQGQNTETDSLKKLLPATTDNHKRVLLLESLSYAYVSAYPDTALQYAIEGLQLAKKNKDLTGEAYCINALGNVYFSVGDYPKALEMYLQSLQMKERLKDQQTTIAVTYFNIANVYTEQEDYRHALYYLFKTKSVDEKAKDSSGILFDLYSLSSIYSRMHNTDTALHYARQAYQLALRQQDKNLLGAIINNTGDIYADLKKFSLAKHNYHQSIFYAQAINDNEVLASNYYGLAKLYKQLGSLDSSIFYAHKSLAIAQQAPFLKQVFETTTLLADVFKVKKQYDSAFKFQELSIAAKDSLYNVEKIKKVQNLKLLEQQRQQSLEVAKVQYRNKVKLYVVIFTSFLFLLIALLLWHNNRQKQKALLLLQQQKKKTDEALVDLKTTQAQLLYKEKMASLGELTAGIAHEIQNPLNFVNNFSETNTELIQELRQELNGGHILEANNIVADIEENEQKINHHGKRADAIVKSMLEHSRSSKGEKQPTDINALVEEYLRLAYHGFRAKEKNFTAAIKTDLDDSIGKINIIPQEIGRVLLNLFNNAFYAIAEREKQLDKRYEPTVWVSTRKRIEKVEILVKDNGMGIPQQAIDKVFQPFFTTKPAGQGTGLGLSLSYDIIKAHGGEFKVESQEGEGTTFTIGLPG